MDLRLGLELPHLALPLPRVLVRNCGPVVAEVPGSMGSRLAEFAAGGRIASQLVRYQLAFGAAGTIACRRELELQPQDALTGSFRREGSRETTHTPLGAA